MKFTLIIFKFGEIWLSDGHLALHQHKTEQREAYTSHHSDKQLAIHSCGLLGHAAHHPDRACDGGEYGD